MDGHRDVEKAVGSFSAALRMKADMLNLMVLSLRLLLSTRNTTLNLDNHDTGKERKETACHHPPSLPIGPIDTMIKSRSVHIRSESVNLSSTSA